MACSPAGQLSSSAGVKGWLCFFRRRRGKEEEECLAVQHKPPKGKQGFDRQSDQSKAWHATVICMLLQRLHLNLILITMTTC